MKEKNILIPTVYEENNGRFLSADIMSRLNKERIIFLADEVNDSTATIVIAQLLYLESVDPKADISLYIMSPGGSVSAGLAIYDVMQYISCDVSTICLGLAASMGAFLLSGGTKGKRYVLPNAEVMIHQPSGGMQGQATEMEIAAEHIKRTKARLNEIISKNTGKSIEEVAIDTDRDNWLTAEQALEYGLVDEIIQTKEEAILKNAEKDLKKNKK